MARSYRYDDDDRPPLVPMNNLEVVAFDSLRGGHKPNDLFALVLVWIWTIGFLVLGIVFARGVSLVVGLASLLVAVPWTVGRVRSRY